MGVDVDVVGSRLLLVMCFGVSHWVVEVLHCVFGP